MSSVTCANHLRSRHWLLSLFLVGALFNVVAAVALQNETAAATGRQRRSLLNGPAKSSPSRPVVTIGILSQPDKSDSYHYIVKAYVDWVEESGYARAIPIPYDAPPTLIDDLFGQINGVLLPGGWNGYMPPSVPYLLDKVMESNARGHYFPVFGICLGYEFLIKYIGGESAIQAGFDSYNTSLPLESVVRPFSQLYADTKIYDTVVNKPVTMNNHKLGIEPSHFLSNPALTAVWNITSVNHDVNGRPFVSTIEPIYADRFPLFGVQYHPEKNGFEYTTIPGTSIPYEAIDHSEEGIDFSLHVSRFFLDRVRRGQRTNLHHSYSKPDVYPTIGDYPLQHGLKEELVYVIPDASNWEQLSSTSLEERPVEVSPYSSDARAYLQMLVSTSAV